MATFTIYLKDVIEIFPDIGLGEYPIFDERHRIVLNQKIVDQYYNHEIGLETVSMFKLAMKRKMSLIMPFYNQHYALSAIALEALSTADFTNEGSTAGNNENTSDAVNDSESDASSRAVSSDTPQTALQENADYATAMQDNISKAIAKAVSNQKDVGKQDTASTNRSHGYQGHQPQLIMAARQTLINIDGMVIDELAELFMQVWSNGDDFTTELREIWK